MRTSRFAACCEALVDQPRQIIVDRCPRNSNSITDLLWCRLTVLSQQERRIDTRTVIGVDEIGERANRGDRIRSRVGDIEELPAIILYSIDLVLSLPPIVRSLG